MRAHKEAFPLDPAFPFAYLDQHLEPGFDMGGAHHWHDCLEISWVLRGHGRYLVEDRVYPMGPGALVVINNLEAHHIEVGPEGMHQPTLIFDPALVWSTPTTLDRGYLGPFFDRGSDFSNRIDPQAPGAEQVRAELLAIASEATTKGLAWQLAVKAHLLLLLTRLVRDFSPGSAPELSVSRRQQMQRLEATLRYLEAHHERDVTLDEAAAVCHLSPTYFSGYFKKATGQGFVEWLNRYRVHRALDLLASTTLTVTTIAHEVGFNSTTTFNQSFRRVTGRRPSDVRR